MAAQYTKAEVAEISEQFLDGGGGAWDWDDFVSIPIADPGLDDVRRRCDATRDEAYQMDLSDADVHRLMVITHAGLAREGARRSSWRDLAGSFRMGSTQVSWSSAIRNGWCGRSRR